MNKIYIFGLSSLLLLSCTKKQHAYSDEQVLRFKQEFEKYVEQKNAYLKSDESPLLKSDIPDFQGLNYYEYNPDFRFEGSIILYDRPDTVIIYGTKKDERPSLKYGYFEFYYNQMRYRLEIFKILAQKEENKDYLFLGFTDLTSNEETYGGGRYINLELNEKNQYIVDFNYAYNPYCAYNPKYSCAIPSRENHLNIDITAGEQNFHDH